MLPELTFMKGYRTLCVSIIELQINNKIRFTEAEIFLLPKHHPQASVKFPKIL